jgi:pimeloyl-ACP methyl ester carboxylesterase/DNA-binding CsgD family transcriptional regulator
MSKLNPRSQYEDLTEREEEILLLISEGNSNQEIADALHLTHGTVKWYASQIYSKLDVSNRAEAVTRAHELNLIPGVDVPSAPTNVLQVVPKQGEVDQTIRIMNSFDGTKIAYAVSGSGPPLIEVAHFLSHLELEWKSPVYRHLLNELMRNHRLIRYDERGTGMSDWDVDDHSFEAWVRDLECLVDITKSKRFPLFGKSQAGTVAIAYAARHPEKVSHLILLGTYAVGSARQKLSQQQREELEAEAAMIKVGWDRINPAYRHYVATNEFPQGPIELVQEMEKLIQASSTADNIVKMVHTMQHVDVSELAKQIRVPTLIFHAIDDQICPFEQGRLLASLIPNAQFVALDTMNHLLVEGEPAWHKFQHHLRRFLRS